MNRSKYLSQLKAKNIEVRINVLTDEEVKKLLSSKNGCEERRSSCAAANVFEKIDFHVRKPVKKSTIADAISSQANVPDTGSFQVNVGSSSGNNAGSSEVSNSDPVSSPQTNNPDDGCSQVNIANAGPSQVNIANAGPSQVNIANAGPSQVNIANAGPSQVNIAERCTPLMKKSYKSNTSSQLIDLASTLPSSHTSSVSSAVNEDISDSKLTNTFFEDFTIQTSAMSILPCKRPPPSSSIGDQKDDRKSHKIQLPAGGVPKKRKADSTSSLGSDSSVTHIGSNENALTNIHSNCTTNTKLCGAENFTTDLEVKRRIGEQQAYQTYYSSSNSSQANFSEDEMMINESDISSAKSLTSMSFNTMSENEPKEGTKIPEQGNDVILDKESIITSKETSQEKTAAAEQKTNFHLELDHYIKHFSRLPNTDYTDIISDARDTRSTEVQEVGNQNKEETESSSSTSALAEILNEKQGGETESLIEVPSELTDKMNTYTSNHNLENAAPFPFYEEKAVFTERSAKTTCGSKQHNSDSASSLDHHLYTTERNWECQNNKNKEDVELFATPNQNIEDNSINAHASASYSRQFFEEPESGIPLLVNHYSKEQFDHENIAWLIEKVPNHNILEEQVESGKTNVWTCSDESPHKNMEIDISYSDCVQKYLQDISLNQPSEELSTTCPRSQNSYDAKDKIRDETLISTFTSVHSDDFMNNEVLNEGTSIKQVTLNQDDKIDPCEKLVKDGMNNGIDSYLDNGNWLSACVEEYCASFTENDNQASFTENDSRAEFPVNDYQAAFPYGIMQEQTGNEPTVAFSSSLAVPKRHDHGGIDLSQNHYNQMPLVEECVEISSQEKNISTNIKCEQAVPKVVVLDRSSDMFFYTLKDNACEKVNCHVNDQEQLKDASNEVNCHVNNQEQLKDASNEVNDQEQPKDASNEVNDQEQPKDASNEVNCHVKDQEQLNDASNANFDITLPWLFSPHENPNI